MDGVLPEMPLTNCVAAVSAGIVGTSFCWICATREDSSAQVDPQLRHDRRGELVELQGTGEGRPFTIVEQRALVELCAKGIRELQNIQRQVLGAKCMKLVLASKNAHKLVEMRDILSQLGVEVVLESEVGVDVDVEETGATFEENAF